ncbi:unnamed protein product, partial [Staurois parvus]
IPLSSSPASSGPHLLYHPGFLLTLQAPWTDSLPASFCSFSDLGSAVTRTLSLSQHGLLPLFFPLCSLLLHSPSCPSSLTVLLPPPPAPDAPVIDTQRTYAYDQIYLSWRLPQDSAPAWHYTVEYRKTDPKHKTLKLWQRREEIWGLSTVLEGPDIDSVYVLRVRGYNKAGYGEYSEDIYLHHSTLPSRYSSPTPGTAHPLQVQLTRSRYSSPAPGTAHLL